jgi:cytidylate kinase
MKTGCGKRKQKIVICTCGMTGCGKSTVAKKLAEKYGLRYLSGGDALKALAIEAGYKPAEVGWWETDEGMRFLRQRIEISEFDKKVDGKLLELAKQGNAVLDSWTMPWLVKEGFKVWLEVSSNVRARRLAVRDGISIERASEILRMKDESTRAIYKSLYGFDLGNDFSPFNLILDANELSADEVFNAVCLVVDRLIFGKFRVDIIHV